MRTLLKSLALFATVACPVRDLWGAASPAAAASTKDPIAIDEQTLATNIKALSDPENAVREAAAGKIREIVAKYPSHTVNIREADGGEARWRALLDQLKPGMTEEEVRAFLKPISVPAGFGYEPSSGNAISVAVSFFLDEHWRCRLGFVPSRNKGEPRRLGTTPRILEASDRWVVPGAVPVNYTGKWTLWYSSGAKFIETTVVGGKGVEPAIEYFSDGRIRVETIELDAEQHLVRRTTHQKDGSAVVELMSPGKPVSRTIVPAEKPAETR